MNRFVLTFAFLSFLSGVIEARSINCILIIENYVVMSSDGVCHLLTNDGRVIEMKYAVGKGLMMSDADFLYLTSLPENEKIVFEFSYRRPERYGKRNPTIRFLPAKLYSVSFEVKYLLQGYLILVLYDFSIKDNKRCFYREEGYGFELVSPLNCKILPRKKRKGCRCHFFY